MNQSQHQVGPDTVVHFRYELRDEEGELVEVSEPGVELSFLFGYGQLTPAFELAMEGLRPGERNEVLIPHTQAFGPRDPNAIIEVDRNELPEELAVGDEFEADHESGAALGLTVLEILDDRVVLDANHPLAGQNIKLSVMVDAVRPATSDEIAFAEEELDAAQTASNGSDAAQQTSASGALARGDFDAQGLLPAALLLRRATSPDDDGID